MILQILLMIAGIFVYYAARWMKISGKHKKIKFSIAIWLQENVLKLIIGIIIASIAIYSQVGFAQKLGIIVTSDKFYILNSFLSGIAGVLIADHLSYFLRYFNKKMKQQD